jgi:thermitase
VLIGAAGNSNSDAPTFPASLEGTIGICAVDPNDQKAPFSNYGTYVDVCSPGVNLITPYLGSHWQMVSGTSGAAAMVSGLAALVKQHAGTREESVRERVEDSAVRLNVPSEYRNKLGKGRIDAYRAVTSNSDRND